PEKVEIAGTLRTMNEEWREKIKHQIRDISEGIATAMGAVCQVDIKDGYPVVFNHEQLTRDASRYASEFIGKEAVAEMDIRMTAEDFGYYTHLFPSVFYRFGVGQKEGNTGALHTSEFNLDENSLETAAGVMAWLAVKFLDNTR
ncbi:MAG TPA: M20/M25/M40 family metallo-hydrolase, partial [Bacteroidales bacterium]|nr:M20/M25/M40 family metallo-hydrolase [Bacteroidales bacterium]